MKSITLPARAKLNLTLDILRKRADGYHDPQMVMQTVSLHDDVTVALVEGEGVVCRCGDIPGDESNLAVRAARAGSWASAHRTRAARPRSPNMSPLQRRLVLTSSFSAIR